MTCESTEASSLISASGTEISFVISAPSSSSVLAHVASLKPALSRTDSMARSYTD